MLATIDIRTFASASKLGSPRQKDPDEILREVLETLTEDLRSEIYSRRDDRQATEDGMGPVTVCVRPDESKSRGYNLPDVWFQISIPRTHTLELRRTDLHGALSQIILNAFGDSHFTIRIDLDLVETLSKQYNSALISG